MIKSKKLIYNWQTEPEGFLKWLLVSIVPRDSDVEVFEKLSDATDKFTNIELSISVNGIEMDAQRFLDGVQRNMNHNVELEANSLLSQFGRFDELREMLDAVEYAAKKAIEDELTKNGISIEIYED
jgi:hypothetical protein